MQLDMFDQAEEIKQEAIERVDAHAAPDWKMAALDAVANCALAMQYFTSDDVWGRIDPAVYTHEPRAMGAVMMKAARERFVVKTGQYRPSKKLSQHKQPIAIWKSLIYVETTK